MTGAAPALSVNPLLRATDAPPIPAAKAWASLYDGRHGPLIDLSQAAPGDPPPPELLARLGEAAASAEAAKYGPVVGDPALIAATAAESARAYGVAIHASEVAITAGANQAFFAAMLAIAKAGDAVLLPVPWYFNHKMALDMLGIEARPLPSEADEGFVPDPDAAEGLIDGRVRAIVLVTPNNPTGAVYPPATIAAFGRLARRRGIALVLDETYRDFRDPGLGPPHELFGWPDWQRTVIHITSFSKAYAVPGHRVGAMIAGRDVVTEAAKALDTIQICPPRAAQIALAWAVEGVRAWRQENAAEMARRRAAFAAAVGGLPGWRIDSLGAYFAYVRHPGGGGADAFARRLCAEAGVLALPGGFFGPGQESHLRLAFANVGIATIAALPGRLGALGTAAAA